VEDLPLHRTASPQFQIFQPTTGFPTLGHLSLVVDSDCRSVMSWT
jgi:hypothetical protein